MTTVTPPLSFRLERQPLELKMRLVRLTQREWLTPDYVRLRFEGADLRGFASLGSDDHCRLFFPEVAPSAPEELRGTPSREYTPLAWDADAGWLDVEFLIHGEGLASPWAATAEIGAVAGVGGPRGSMVLSGSPDAWFLAGDETAVPAMRRFARSMDAEAVGRIIVEVPDAAHELPIDAPAGVVVEQVHRGTDAAASALARRLEALGAQDRPNGDVFGFIAAEQSIVKVGRGLLIDRWGLSTDSIVVKGYWKRGEAEYHAPH